MFFKGWFWPVWGAVGVAMHIGLVLYGLAPNLVVRPLHMAYILPWVFLATVGTGLQRATGWFLTLTGMAACLWIAINADALGDQYGSLEGSMQTIIAIALLLVTMEGAESQADIDLLSTFDCDYIQGYFLGLPISLTEMEDVLRKLQAGATAENGGGKSELAY